MKPGPKSPHLNSTTFVRNEHTYVSISKTIEEWILEQASFQTPPFPASRICILSAYSFHKDLGHIYTYISWHLRGKKKLH